MTYAQWIIIRITPINCKITIRDAVALYGKFHDGNKDNEIEPPNGVTIEVGATYIIYACGRSDSPSGTEGSFSIFTDEGFVGTYQWDCPWGTTSNISVWTPGDSMYITQITGANVDSGAIGTVDIKITNSDPM